MESYLEPTKNCSQFLRHDPENLLAIEQVFKKLLAELRSYLEPGSRIPLASAAQLVCVIRLCDEPSISSREGDSSKSTCREEILTNYTMPLYNQLNATLQAAKNHA